MTQEEWEQAARKFDAELEKRDWLRPKPKPVAVVSLPVSDNFAKVAAANPASVGVHARTAEGVTVIEKPLRNENCVTLRTDLVLEIDAQGRPVWDDELPGATHEYHPWNGLSR